MPSYPSFNDREFDLIKKWVINTAEIAAGGGGGGAVSSVFGRAGAVTAQATDYQSFYASLSANNSFTGLTNSFRFNVNIGGVTEPGIVSINGFDGDSGRLEISDPTGNFFGRIQADNLTDYRTIQLPDISGTMALTSDLGSYAPINSPAFTGDATFPNAGLGILDTNASNRLILSAGSDITADRTLTFITGDANRSITLSGNFVLQNSFSVTGGFTTVLNVSATTTATLPQGTVTLAGLGTSQTFTGINTLAPTARTSGVSPYLTINTPADTGITASTEAIGIDFGTATRTWATTGTVALQREYWFRGKTYASAGASQTFTDIATVFIDRPLPGTNAIFTRGHSLLILDANTASSSITGGLVVSTAIGTAATSVGIGNGNINAGGTITSGGTIASGGSLTASASITAGSNLTTPQITSNGAGGLTYTTISATSAGHLFTNTARTSGASPYFTMTPPADTGRTASTESIGVSWATSTRTWATTGTVALQRERFFAGPTYASASASQTFTDAFNLYLTPPIAGTNAIFTRGHTLGIVDATSSASPITGGLIVATTLGTAATSVGIGGGNINAGGTITAGGPVVYPSYLVSGLPSAGSYPYAIVAVSNDTNPAGTALGTSPTGGGTVRRMVYSDGTSWLLM